MIDDARDEITLQATPDGNDCLLTFQPGTGDRPLVSVDRIYDRARELGFPPNTLLPRDKLQGLLRTAAEKSVHLTGLSICRPVDSECVIQVSPDNLFATLILKKSQGKGKPLRLDEISRQIKSSGITQLDIHALKERILSFFNDPARRDYTDSDFARGVLPGQGGEGALAWEISFLDAGKKTVLLDRFAKQPAAEKSLPSLAQFPLSDVTELALVIPEQKIALVNPPSTGKDGTDVFGKPIPGQAGGTIRITTFENVRQFGYYYVSDIRGICEYGKRGDEHLFRVRPHQDAGCFVELSQDRMKAFLTISAHRGHGEPISDGKMGAALHEAGVMAGLKRDVIRDAVTLGQGGKDVAGLLIAEGQAPVHAQGARFIVRVTREKKKRVRILEDGRADFKAPADIAIVRKGDLVAEITPPLSDARDGFDVTGARIPATTRAASEIPNLVNLRQVPAPGGGAKLFAETDGEFFMIGVSAGVKRLHVIAGNVGLETGNVRFPGSVMVAGNVQAGFTVFSQGDITVMGMVEEALLSADGSITIEQGVKGHAKAVLRAKEDITCLFAENATLLAVGDVTLLRSSLHSMIKCNGRLLVGKIKGTLMGGTTRAKMGMILVNLGSTSEVKTVVSFGQDYLLMDQIEKDENEVTKLKTRVGEIDGAMAALQRTAGPVGDKLASLRDEKIGLLKKIEAAGLRLFNMRERIEAYFPGEIVIRGTVFPGVTIESHGRFLSIKQEKRAVRYSFNPKTGAIEESTIIFAKKRPGRSA